jgi:hypothetical protein
MEMHSYALRVPVDVWVELKAAARVNRRSVNQEIVWRLSERDHPGEGKVRAGVASSAPTPTQLSSELAQGTGGSSPGPLREPSDALTTDSFVAHHPPVGRSTFKPDFGSRLKGGS